MAMLRARGSFKWTAPGPGRVRRRRGGDGLRCRAGDPRRARRAVRRRELRLPAAVSGRGAGRGVRGFHQAPLRLGRRSRADPSRPRRDQGAGDRHHALLPARLAGHPAHARLHAVPHRAGLPRPRDHPGADARRRRLLHPRPRRDRGRVPGRGTPAHLLQPVQPARAGLHRPGDGAADRRRRPARRPGLRRRDPRPARLPRGAPHPLRVHLRCRRVAHPDRHVRLEGVEPARPQVRRR